MKQTRTKIPEGVTRVRNVVTGEVQVIAPITTEQIKRRAREFARRCMVTGGKHD